MVFRMNTYFMTVYEATQRLPKFHCNWKFNLFGWKRFSRSEILEEDRQKNTPANAF